MVGTVLTSPRLNLWASIYVSAHTTDDQMIFPRPSWVAALNGVNWAETRIRQSVHNKDANVGTKCAVAFERLATKLQWRAHASLHKALYSTWSCVRR